MASQADIAATYDYLDEFWRATFGDLPDITAALFDGDFRKTLTQAQIDKHDYILRSLQFTPGCRVLDIGCGWGGLLRTVHERGGRGVGWTLSPSQAAACRRGGLDVDLRDWKIVDTALLDRFHGIASVGAFEHFCSEDEYLAGRQDDVYRAFFRCCAELLESGGHLYVQTMLWGDAIPDPATISLDAKAGSDAFILGLLRYFYPGSWLPSGLAQIERVAAPWFTVVSTKNGRLDYIETISRWGRAATHVTLPKLLAASRLVPRIVRDPHLRCQLRSMWHNCNQECFRRRLMDHERILLRRTFEPVIGSAR
jgi:cyclopropane-fatty-acyl-phospholipid synthase